MLSLSHLFSFLFFSTAPSFSPPTALFINVSVFFYFYFLAVALFLFSNLFMFCFVFFPSRRGIRWCGRGRVGWRRRDERRRVRRGLWGGTTHFVCMKVFL